MVSATTDAATGTAPTAKHPGLLEKLMLAIRPEFRSEVVVFAPDDPVFGGTVCQVGECGRVSHSSTGLCRPHYQRWTRHGRSDLNDFRRATSSLVGAQLRHSRQAPAGRAESPARRGLLRRSPRLAATAAVGDAVRAATPPR